MEGLTYWVNFQVGLSGSLSTIFVSNTSLSWGSGQKFDRKAHRQVDGEKRSYGDTATADGAVSTGAMS